MHDNDTYRAITFLYEPAHRGASFRSRSCPRRRPGCETTRTLAFREDQCAYPARVRRRGGPLPGVRPEATFLGNPHRTPGLGRPSGAGKSETDQNRALTAVKSLLSFAQETGYVPFNVGVAVKLRPGRDDLAQRILEESQVAKLIDAGTAGRNRVLLKLLYVSGVRVSELCGLQWCDALSRKEGGQI